MVKNIQFLNPTVTVDDVVFTIESNELKVLLIRREGEPYKNLYALPGGYLHKGETTKDGASRILEEKAGVEDVYIEQLYTFDGLHRDPRGPVFSVTYMALAPSPFKETKDKSKTQHPTLFPIKNLPKLAFDHSEIVKYAIKRMQSKLEYTNVAFSILPDLFTLSQLQNVYELILDKKIDKRNFRKKIEQLRIIKETKKMLRGGRQRPAKLYTFVSKKPLELKKFF